MASDPSKIHSLQKHILDWIDAGSPSAEELKTLQRLPVEPSEHRIPTNYRFWGIAIAILSFFSVGGYKMGGKDINTTRSLDMLTLKVQSVAKIVGPISTALDGVRSEISDLKDEVVRLQSSQVSYDIELAKTQADISALKEILENNITSGDKRSIDLFNDLNTKVTRNEARLGTLRSKVMAVHPEQ